METSKLKVLFLCTGNSARSILGEYLLRRHGADRFDPVSAGAAPTGRVHPLALKVLAEDYGIDASDAQSESWQTYADAGVDLVITVCDHARDTCPLFPGDALRVHWGSPDPAAFEGGEEEALEVFRGVAREIEDRVRRMCELPWAGRTLRDLEPRLAEIGRDGSS